MLRCCFYHYYNSPAFSLYKKAVCKSLTKWLSGEKEKRGVMLVMVVVISLSRQEESPGALSASAS